MRPVHPAVVLMLALAACDAGPAPIPGVSAPPIDGASIRRTVSLLGTDRFYRSSGHVRAREAILDRLQAWELAPRVVPFTWEGLEDVDLANIELRFPGGGSSGESVLVTAHYDAVEGAPGADDNASGAGGLLELARRLRERRFEREVRLIWFDAEEPGLLGSTAYVRALAENERESIAGVINLEAIAFTDRRADSQRMPPGVRMIFDPGSRGDFLLVLGNLSSRALADVVHESLEQEQSPGFRAEVFSMLPGKGWMMPDARRSDHAPFWDVGVPAVMLTDTANFRNPHYHRSSDRLDTLDFDFLAAALRGVERAVVELAGPLAAVDR